MHLNISQQYVDRELCCKADVFWRCEARYNNVLVGLKSQLWSLDQNCSFQITGEPLPASGSRCYAATRTDRLTEEAKKSGKRVTASDRTNGRTNRRLSLDSERADDLRPRDEATRTRPPHNYCTSESALNFLKGQVATAFQDACIPTAFPKRLPPLYLRHGIEVGRAPTY